MQYQVLIIIILLLVHPVVSIAQKTKAYALIVGLKSINETNYKDKYNKVYDESGIEGVDNDCKVIEKIAKENNYKTSILRDKNATRKNILASLDAIGKEVQRDTSQVFFMFYFSGHGDTIPDKSGDEANKYDEVLVSYDDFVVDDEINRLLIKYFKKSQNLMIVDACHSGSSNKIFLAIDFTRHRNQNKKNFFANETKAIIETPDFSNCSFHELEPIKEPYNLIYFGATGDNEYAAGGPLGGAFTFSMDKIIRDAKYYGDWKSMTYRTLACRIAARLSAYQQNLTYREIGEKVNNFTNKQPFKID
jgi:metacaspase-1